MPNRGQLNLLTPSQAAAIRAIGDGLLHAEVVKISWPDSSATPPGPGVVYYAWSQLDQDPAYSNISTFLAGRPLIAAFPVRNPVERFHELVWTAAIGDDVVEMEFSNHNGEFEELCYKHRGGVYVDFYHYFPQIDGGLAKLVWTGHLRNTTESTEEDEGFIRVTVAHGFRTPNAMSPNYAHDSGCGFYFGGELTAAEHVGNPCGYNRHLPSGTRGNLDPATGLPYTKCDHTKAACLLINGDLEEYGGDDTATDQTVIGLGQHTTLSKVVGNQTRLIEPIGVPYGEFVAENLPLLAYAKEINPSAGHQEFGTLRTLFEVGWGPIEEISEIRVMDSIVGAEHIHIRLGEQRQAKTFFSPNVLNYNRRAHFQANINPIDPRRITPQQATGRCKFKGRNTIKVYAEDGTFTEEYTNNRADCLREILETPFWGYGLDPDLLPYDDTVYLRGQDSPFDLLYGGIGKIHEKLSAICLAGPWYRPFQHNGQWRFMPIEEVDLAAADIPTFATTGVNRNILYRGREESRARRSRLKGRFKDDDQIQNEAKILYNDATLDYLQRTITVRDKDLQFLAGKLEGSLTKRKVETTESAYGLTSEQGARSLGERILQLGRFNEGGTDNNAEITFVGAYVDPDYFNLHPTKIIKPISTKLNKYKDRAGNPFTHYQVKALRRNRRGELEVTAQAFKNFRESDPSGVLELALNFAVSGYDSEAISEGTPIATHINFCEGSVCEPVQFTCVDAEHWASAPSGSSILSCGPEHGVAPCPNPVSVQRLVRPGQSFKWKWSGESISFNGIAVADLNKYYDPSEPFTCAHLQPNQSANIWFYAWVLNTVVHTLGTDARPLPFLPFQNISPEFVGGFSYDEDTIFEIRRTAFGIEFLLDGVVMRSVNLTYPPPNTAPQTNPPTTLQAAATRAVLFDRIWRQTDSEAGRPGLYWAAASDDLTRVWNGAQLYRDNGGYTVSDETASAATLGRAATVLAGTVTGSETVNVTLAPGQTLAATGLRQGYLGGEIFKFNAATLVSGTTYTLSGLTERGAFESGAFIGTHAVNEPFVLLDERVRFVPVSPTEVGQTRNYKAVTFGAALSGATAMPFTLTAPNYRTGRWELLMNGSITDPQIIYYDGEPVYVWVER